MVNGYMVNVIYVINCSCYIIGLGSPSYQTNVRFCGPIYPLSCHILSVTYMNIMRCYCNTVELL